MKYCPNCGSDLTEGTKFCPACGYMISDYTAASEPLPEREIFPEPGSKKTEGFGFDAEPSRAKSDKYDPFSSDAAPRYSDYTTGGAYESGSYGSGTYDSESYESSSSSERFAASETNGFAVAALVMGIIALLFDFLIFIPSVLAVVFGIVGLKRSEETGTGRGMSIAGIVLGIIAFSIYLVVIICAVVFTGVLISL